MALIIAGERSGVGKTTVTLALLSFLSQKGYKVQSFKVGPDYIDPMFHTTITGRFCRNLDPLLTSQAYVQSCFTRHCAGFDYALIEGVMGLFDGMKIADTQGQTIITDYASTAHIARLLNLPILLVIDCSRLSGSVAAIAQGYRSLDPRVHIAGVVLNRVGSSRHLTLLKEALEPLNLPILGVLHRQEQISIADRHLGLVPTPELPHLPLLFDKLAHLALNAFDWEKLFPLLLTPPPPASCLQPPASSLSTPIKITIAQDKAFNFYYQDNLDIFAQLGAELIPWSPIEQPGLPEGVKGLYFGGGFPEVFAAQLADNQKGRDAVRKAIIQGMPTYAECGGLMYLCQELRDFEGKTWPMVGILPTTAKMSSQLTLGYRQATAVDNSLLLSPGDTVLGHEFHRSQLTTPCNSPLYTLKGLLSESPIYTEGWNIKQVHASYLHLHFGGCPSLAQKFLASCVDFSKKVR